MENTQTPKKLYRIREGQMIAGVANGIAAYLDIDVTLVRVAFVAFIFMSSGGFILAYFVMMALMPVEGGPGNHWQDKWNSKLGRYHRHTHTSDEAAGEHPRYRYAPQMRHRRGVVEEVVQLLFVGLGIYLVYTYIPQTQPFFDQVWAVIQMAWQWFIAHLNTPVR